LNAQGEAEAKLTSVQADGQCAKVNAETQSLVAQKNAEAVQIQGKGEADLKQVLGLRRFYSFLNAKLEVIRFMSLNPNLKIFGKSDDSNLSQLAAYSIMNGASHL
jgi:regulator of protease activity HflC (stomatin/prohibitin superfamily)